MKLWWQLVINICARVSQAKTLNCMLQAMGKGVTVIFTLLLRRRVAFLHRIATCRPLFKPRVSLLSTYGQSICVSNFYRAIKIFVWLSYIFNVMCIKLDWKEVIKDNIIEQVTDFKYLGYRMSEYGSDLGDKLQTYNRINGNLMCGWPCIVIQCG